MANILFMFKKSSFANGVIDQKMVADCLLAILSGVFGRLKTKGPGYFLVRRSRSNIASGIICAKNETAPDKAAQEYIYGQLESLLDRSPPEPEKVINIIRQQEMTAIFLRTKHETFSCAYYDAAENADNSRAGLVIAASALYLLSETWFNHTDFRTAASALINDQRVPEIRTTEISQDFEKFVQANPNLIS